MSLLRRVPFVVGALATLASLSVATMAWAGGSPRAHDSGFFLRLSAGVNAASTSIEDADGDELSFSDLGGDANFAVGAIISNNLALHGTFFGWAVSEPDVEVNGTDVGTFDEDLSMSAVGGGITYYFMPANVYLSPSIGLAWLSAGDSESDTGMALDFTVGKEWWVGNSWGLGVAGTVGFHSIPDDSIDENWSDATFGVRFSATLN